MNAIERQKKILDLLANKEFISVEELAGTLGASLATIRRDLTAMEQEKTVIRYRGGVIPAQKQIEKAMQIEVRMDENRQEKEKIARYAASLIEDGEYIYIDSSSTTYLIPGYITATDVTVVTNAVFLIPELLRNGIRTFVLGGFIDANGNYVMGEMANEQIKSMNFSKSFIGTYAVEENRGLTTYEISEADLKKLIIQHSSEIYVLADHTKFSKKGFIIYATPDQATIITDAEPVNPGAYPSLVVAE